MAFRWTEALSAVLAYEHDRFGETPDGKARTRSLAGLIAARAGRRDLADATAGLFQERPIALVSFDADRISGYILTTTRLAEMRGASAAVRLALDEVALRKWFTELGLREAASCAVLFAGGGNGLVLTPAGLAGKVARLIEDKFTENTYGGTCTAVLATFWPEELVWGRPAPPRRGEGLALTGSLWNPGDDAPLPFGVVVGHLGARLRRKKSEKLTGAGPTVLPGIIKRCESCGQAPVETEGEPGEDGETHEAGAAERQRRVRAELCRSCLRKQDFGKQRAPDEAGSIDDIVHRQTEAAGSDQGDRGRPGYVAVAHFDGNGMGACLETLATAEAVAEFSSAVSGFFRDCRRYVAEKLRLPGAADRTGRYQAPLFGGDDLLLILPAEEAVNAVELAMDFLDDCFTGRKAAGRGNPVVREVLAGITVNCGFVCAPAHYPISLLFDYARRMLESAKDLSYRLGPTAPAGGTGARGYPAAVDYIVLKDSSPLSLSPTDFRRERYALPDMTGWFYSGRPYLYQDFKSQIAPAARRLDRIPGAQLALAVRLLNQHPSAARLELAHQIYVRADRAWQPLLKPDPGTGWRGLGRKWLDFFVVESSPGGVLGSRFLDALELWQAGRR